MAAKSNFTNMVLCLTLVCIFCAALLGGVNSLTKDPIAKAQQEALKLSIGKVLPEGGELSEAKTLEFAGQTYEYYEQTLESSVEAYAVKSFASGFGGNLEVMVGVLADGTVFNTAVLSHSETPGLGAKCEKDEKFLSQFRGFSPEKSLTVSKDGGDVDAITAATITSRAYTLAVSNAVGAVLSLTGKTSEEDEEVF